MNILFLCSSKWQGFEQQYLPYFLLIQKNVFSETFHSRKQGQNSASWKIPWLSVFASLIAWKSAYFLWMLVNKKKVDLQAPLKHTVPYLYFFSKCVRDAKYADGNFCSLRQKPSLIFHLACRTLLTKTLKWQRIFSHHFKTRMNIFDARW